MAVDAGGDAEGAEVGKVGRGGNDDDAKVGVGELGGVDASDCAAAVDPELARGRDGVISIRTQAAKSGLGGAETYKIQSVSS